MQFLLPLFLTVNTFLQFHLRELEKGTQFKYIIPLSSYVQNNFTDDKLLLSIIK